MFSVLVRKLAIASTLAISFLLGFAPAEAQILQTTVPITFTGVVSNSVADTIMIRQPDGSYVPYTGPVPAYPYDQGTPVKITFNATLPTKEYYASPQYKGQIAADGIYRLQLATTSITNTIGYNTITTPLTDLGGPIGTSGQQPTAFINLVFDTNTNTYSLEGSGKFLASYYSGPGFRYDGTTGQLIGCATGFECSNGLPGSFHLYGPGDNLFRLTGDSTGTQVSTGSIPIIDDITNGIAGYFGLTLKGSWNLPQFGGGATQVPEPGMLGLFGSGVLLLVARRRRRVRA